MESSIIKRIDYIDTARGFAIVLVILQHSIGGQVPGLSNFILSFHMPLFFFLSGVFAKQGGYTLLINKCRSLLVPQITLSCINFIQYALENFFLGKNVLDSLSFSLNGGWFLPVMFLSQALFLFVISVTCDTTWIKYGMLVISLPCVFIAQSYNNSNIGAIGTYFTILPIAFIFYVSGNLCKQVLSINKEFKYGLLISMIVLILANLNTPVLMYLNKYGNLTLFFICAYLGIYAILYFSKLFVNNIFLKTCGRVSGKHSI